MTKEKQPGKTVDQYRGKVLNGELMGAKVTVHQDVLLNLFDPREKGQTHFIKNLSENSRIELSSDPRREIIAPENLRRLPTLTEFKMFLWIYKQALLQGTRELTFTSTSECLKTLGYSHCEDNFKLLRDTIFVYMGLDVAFENCFHYLDRKGVKHVDRDVKGFKFFNQLSYVRDTKTKNFDTINAITIIFDESFWKFNTEDIIKHLDVNKLMQLKSPLAVKLYLYFTKWSDKQNSYRRVYKESVDHFFMNLGYDMDNLTLQQYRFKLFKLKQALNEIYAIDKNMNFKLIEELYKTVNNRQIRFTKIERKKLSHDACLKLQDRIMRAAVTKR